MGKGLCRGTFPRWWYNRRTGSCEKFTYSGCQGNDNNFVTKEFCERECTERSYEGKYKLCAVVCWYLLYLINTWPVR